MARTSTPRTPKRRERGTGTVTALPDGRYRAFAELPPDPATGRRRRVSATGKTRSEALSRVRKRLRDIDRTGQIRTGASPRLSEWLTQVWIPEFVERTRKPHTAAQYRSAVRRSIIPAIGAMRLRAITPAHVRMVERYVLDGDPEHDVQPRSGTVAEQAYAVLRTALDDAVREGLIRENPARRVRPPKRNIPHVEALTPEEAGRMISMETDPQWHIMWQLAFLLGMRQGERLGITGSELVRRDGVYGISIQWQLAKWSGIRSVHDLPQDVEARHVHGAHWLTRPKTRAGRRFIPLPESLAAEIAALAKAKRLGPDDLLFTNPKVEGSPTSRPLTRHMEQQAWKRALERAGITRHCHPHSARHTCATILARQHVNDAVRIAIIGHSTIRTTDEYYVNVGVCDSLQAITGVAGLILPAA